MQNYHEDEEIRVENERHAGIVIFDAKILLMYRRKDMNEYYALPGGHRRKGEKGQACCIREIFEETGLLVHEAQLVFDFFNPYKKEHEYYYLCSVREFQNPFLNGEEKIRNSKKNYYEPLWIDLCQVETLNIVPPKIKKYLPNIELVHNL